MKTYETMEYDNLFAPKVINQIRDMMEYFTESQRVLAGYILQRPEKVGFLTVKELAQSAGVSVATVVRFCNKLGYKGYVQLGQEVQESIQNELSTLTRFNLSQSAFTDGEEKSKTAFERILILENESLCRLVQTINKADFYNCIDWMSEAEHVVIIGTMASSSLANYFGYAAAKILPSVRVVTSVDAQSSDFLKEIGKTSLAFILAFPRYPRATLELGTMVKKQRCKIVSITDNHQSPIVHISNITFLISISVVSIVDAYAAPIAFINGLITEFAEHNPEKVKKVLVHFENFAAGVEAWWQSSKN